MFNFTVYKFIWTFRFISVSPLYIVSTNIYSWHLGLVEIQSHKQEIKIPNAHHWSPSKHIHSSLSHVLLRKKKNSTMGRTNMWSSCLLPLLGATNHTLITIRTFLHCSHLSWLGSMPSCQLPWERNKITSVALVLGYSWRSWGITIFSISSDEMKS